MAQIRSTQNDFFFFWRKRTRPVVRPIGKRQFQRCRDRVTSLGRSRSRGGSACIKDGRRRTTITRCAPCTLHDVLSLLFARGALSSPLVPSSNHHVCLFLFSVHDSSRSRRRPPPRRAVVVATRRRQEGTYSSRRSRRRTEAAAVVVVPPRAWNSAPAIGRVTVRKTRTPSTTVATTTTATDGHYGRYAIARPCRCPRPPVRR